jgi:hypothetical protein
MQLGMGAMAFGAPTMRKKVGLMTLEAPTMRKKMGSMLPWGSGLAIKSVVVDRFY